MYVALDPGKTTGVAVLSSDFVWDRYQVEDLQGVWHAMYVNGGLAVIYEQFVRSPNTFAELDAAEVSGVIKLFGERCPGLPIIPQGRQVKSFWTNEKLKKLDLWIPGMPHAMDATRHLLYYVTTTLKDDRFIMKLK